MQIGDEDGLGVFEIEGPPERDADGEQEEVIDIAADLAPKPIVRAPSSGKLSL